MRQHQTGKDLALANGFESFEALVLASRHMHDDEGGEQFVAITPDGREFVWNESDIEDLDAEERRCGLFKPK